MNILIIEDTASSEKGGAEKSMRYFSEFLSTQENVKVYLAYHNAGNLTEDPMSSIYDGLKQINLYPIKQSGLLNWFKALFQLVSFCKEKKIDLIFTHIIHAFFILRVAKILIGYKYFQYFKWNPSTINIGKLGGWGLKGVDEAYAVSEFTMSYWHRLNHKFHLHNVIADGIPEEFTNAKLNIGSNDNTNISILFAARIYEGKGLHVLIEALSKIEKEKIELNICGVFNDNNNETTNNYKGKIDEQIASLNSNIKVNFFGFQSEITGFINRADLVVVPSVLADAQPLVLLESMRQKKVCIGSNVGGIPEVLSGPLSQLIFQPNNAFDLADKIVEIISLNTSEKEYIQNLLFERYKSKYSLKNTNEKLFSKIKKIMNEQNRI